MNLVLEVAMTEFIVLPRTLNFGSEFERCFSAIRQCYEHCDWDKVRDFYIHRANVFDDQGNVVVIFVGSRVDVGGNHAPRVGFFELLGDVEVKIGALNQQSDVQVNYPG